MAVNVVRGRGKRGAPTAPAPLPIGEIEGDIFNCPVCGRPLAPGARRCQGCGTRLVLGVAAMKASLFMAVGLALGLLTAGAVVGGYAALARPSAAAPPPAPIATASASPSAAAPTAAPTRQGPTIPAMARSALGQAAALHVRLDSEARALAPLLDASRLSASAVERVLRSLAADAAYGSNLPSRIAGWDEAAGLSIELAAFYEDIRETARDGLRHSIANRTAYRAAAVAMLALLEELPALDARTRALARDAGADVPPSAYGP